MANGIIGWDTSPEDTEEDGHGPPAYRLRPIIYLAINKAEDRAAGLLHRVPCQITSSQQG
jgi:hypothetical protein